MALNAADTMATMNGLFKERYAAKIQDAVPNIAKVTRRIPFESRAILGNFYHQPVVLQNEVGFTYLASGLATLPSYNPALPMQMKDAQVTANATVLRSAILYEAMQRAQAAGEQAFEAATLLLLRNMVDSVGNRNEQQLLHGQDPTGNGTIQSMTTPTLVSGSTYQTTIQIQAAQWAIGIWQGQETSYLDFYPNGAAPQTRINSTTVTAGAPQLQAVSPSAGTLLVYGTQADLLAVQTALTAPGTVSIFWGGAYGTEMIGLSTILKNTGTLFSINAAAFDLWQGNTLSASDAPLTLALLQEASGVAASRGAVDEDMLLVCSTQGWADLVISQAALRMFDSSYKSLKFENGAKDIRFYAQTGSLEIIAHPMCKNGEAFLLPIRQLTRIGATEATFDQPGYPTKTPFIPLPDNPAMQAVNYSQWQVFLRTPARGVYLNGIQNTNATFA